jgi:hypothetical protein
MEMLELVRNADGYNEDDYGLPEATETGIRCGNHPRDLRIRHENAAAVRACYAIVAELNAQQAAEVYAEAGMSWVAGGGSPEDACIYASVIASGRTWEEYLGV